MKISINRNALKAVSRFAAKNDATELNWAREPVRIPPKLEAVA